MIELVDEPIFRHTRTFFNKFIYTKIFVLLAATVIFANDLTNLKNSFLCGTRSSQLCEIENHISGCRHCSQMHFSNAAAYAL